MEKTVKLSVIVPVYGVEKYLQACIDALVNQTMKDIEFIFVNDASPDGSLAILRENERKYPDLIRVIDSKENLMQGGARNLGIRAARGEYVGFVDSDDFIHPEMYEKLYNKVVGCDAAFGRYMEVPEGAVLHTFLDRPVANLMPQSPPVALEEKAPDNNDISRLLTENLGGVWCGVWRKSIITDNDIWFPEHLKYEDNYWATLMRCYLRKIAFAPDAVYYYRIRETGTVRSRNNPNHYHRITIEQMLMAEAEKRGLAESYRTAWEFIAITRYCFNTFYHFHHHMDNPDMRTLKTVIKDTKTKYPKWHKNALYREKYSKKQQILHRMIAIAPKIMAVLMKKLHLF